MTDQRLDTDAPMTAADALSSGLVPADGGPPPTARELDLLRQLERKQQEVDDLASTLTLLTRNPTARPPPLPLPPPSSSAAAAPASLLVPSPADEIIIPRTLLPILTHLREHSLSLAAENRELRQLLVASSDAVADEAVIRVPKTEGPSSGSRDQKGRKVNLLKVVDRLRALTEENRELGTVVDALGREVGEARALKAALDEAHETILALDSDLEGSFGQIEALRAILASYEDIYGSLPAADTRP